MADVQSAAWPEKQRLLAADIEEMGQSLARWEGYDLAADLRRRLDTLGLSAKGLGERCSMLSHSAVNKWLVGTARPKGREQVKKIGMALGMGAKELDDFLLKNAYPRLCAKNPMDVIDLRVLEKHAGQDTVVALYDEKLAEYKAGDIPLPPDRESILTSRLWESGAGRETGAGFRLWLDEFAANFSAVDRSMLASSNLVLLVRLYLAGRSVNGLHVGQGLPTLVRDQLYAIKSNSAYPARHLREKLIVLGLFFNLSEEDIDAMMAEAKLLPFTQPATKTDAALQLAVQLGHRRYAYYEYDSLWLRIHHLVEVLYTFALEEAEAPALYTALLDAYTARMGIAEACAAYYDEHRTAEDRLFEWHYTDNYDEPDAEGPPAAPAGEKPDGRLMHYVRDALRLLCEERALAPKEAAVYLGLMREPKAAKG